MAERRNDALRCRTFDRRQRRRETPTVDQLRELIHDIGPGDFLVVERVDPPAWQRYIQMRLRPTGHWVVEYRAGRADRHYEATTEDGALVESVIVGWAEDRRDWRGQLGWQRLPPRELRPLSRSATDPELETAPTSAERFACPNCGEHPPLRIVYGLPSTSMFEAAERGEILLGGCMLGSTAPRWRCSRCGHLWADDGPRLDGSAGIVLDDFGERPKNRVTDALGRVQDDPTPERLRELVGELVPTNPSVRVQHWGRPMVENYAEARIQPSGEYIVEYRAGRPDRHYEAVTDDIALAASALAGWAFNLTGWWGALRWRRQLPNSGSEPAR